MSDVKQLQAAIQKLEQFQATATQGEWWSTRDSQGPDVFAGTGSSDDVLVVSDARRLSDAQLIVTLRRTIDAQLKILRTALAGAVVYQDRLGFCQPYIQNGVELATAILGDTALAEEGSTVSEPTA